MCYNYYTNSVWPSYVFLITNSETHKLKKNIREHPEFPIFCKKLIKISTAKKKRVANKLIKLD